jgi:peptidoglycan/LPS O-acetylase OafA/YrhL
MTQKTRTAEATGLHAPSASGEIKSLTSLRGLAAFMVLLQHFSTTAQSYCVANVPSLAPHGYMAVDFFFVLSGFIMAYTYLDQFQKMGLRAYSPFLLKRIARIAPLGWAVTIAIIAFGVLASTRGAESLFINENAAKSGLARDALVNLLQVQGFFPLFNLNPPSWSISFEFGAYLLFPVLIFLIFNNRLVSSVAVIIGLSAMLVIAYPESDIRLVFNATIISFARSLIEFALGMATYRLFRKQEFARFIGTDASTWTLSALCLALFAARVDLLLELVFPIVVFSWARNRGVASRYMSARLPHFLGLISFSIYLVHNMIRNSELALVKHMSSGPLSVTEALVFVVIGSLTILPVAMLSYYLVERPGRDAVNALAGMARRRLALNAT